MKNKLRVLLTATSGPGTVGIIHSLKSSPTKDIYVIAGSVEGYFDIGRKISDVYVKIPYCSSATYLEEMIYICKKYKVNMIIPAFSDEIEILTKNITVFNELGVIILSPSHEIVHLLHNKELMCKKLEKIDKNIIPNFLIANSVNELKEQCIKMGYPNKEICIKPAKCNGGGRGFFILKENYDREKSFFIEKQSNICSLDELMLKLKGMNNIPTMLIMQYISGEEYGVDVLANNGELVECVIRKRLNPIVAGMEMRAKIVENNIIKSFVENIVKDLNLNSILSFDIRFDDNNATPYLLEINPRQGAYIGFATRKINLLAMAIDLKLKEDIQITTYKTNHKDITVIRYFEEFAIANNNIII